MSASTTTSLAALAGTDLGVSTASYDDTAAILYALAVGAAATELDLVYERDLRTLPTYACALGLWAVEAAGRLGAYDPKQSLHASQRLVVHRPLPTSADIAMTGRVASVLDKGKAALVQVEVDSPMFSATYDIFLPGLGGWGGERGLSSPATEVPPPDSSTVVRTDENLAALYRLTGDRHPVHIDPVVAQANGFERPILHGLCTLGIAARTVAAQAGVHPARLLELDARLAAPVLPGDAVEVLSGVRDGLVHFEARVGQTTVLKAGRARFGDPG
jgi:acyl dehydratase